MNLSAYNLGSYTSVMDAYESGAIYFISDLIDVDDDITANELNDTFNMNNIELCTKWSCVIHTLDMVGQKEDVRAILVNSNNIPKFEMNDKGVWVKIDESFIVEIQSKRSIANLEKSKITAYVCPDGEKFRITFISSATDDVVIERSIDLNEDNDVELNGETFDFTLKQNDDDDSYYIDLRNLVDVGDGDKANWNFNYSISAHVVSIEYVEHYMQDIKMQQIDAHIKTIEKYRGSAYFGPNTKGSISDGDDIYQSLHSIRKLIGIGFEEYNKEVAKAKKEE